MAKSPYEPDWNDGSHRKSRQNPPPGSEMAAKVARMERCPKPDKPAAKKKAKKKAAKKKTT